MRRRNTETIAEVIKQLLAENKLATPLKEMEVVQAWETIMGSVIQKYTTNIYVRHRILNVSLSSSVLRNELAMSRSRIIDSLNNYVGERVIVDIVFR